MTEKEKGAGDKAAPDASADKVTTGAWWKSALSIFPKKKKTPAPEKQSGGGDRQTTDSARQKREAVAVDPDRGGTKTARTQDSEDGSASRNERGPKRPRRRKRGPRRDAAGSKPVSPENQEKQQDLQKQPKQQKEERVRENIVTKLLINAEEPEECRIALIEDGKLESFHVASVVRERTKNNIYKGRIVSVEPNLQAAFVEIGTDRNGFLPFDEIHPEYFREDVDDRSRKLITEHQWKKLKIENVVKKGQEVLVQVVKEVTGNKGANMTTYLSIPGRYLVLMPGSDSAGISRKIPGDDKRFQLREMMNGFSVPEGIGWIIRTASQEITKTALQKDLRYLLRLWDEIKKKGQELKNPGLIYGDQDIVVRFLRDHFAPDIQEIIVDTDSSFEQVQKFVNLLPGRQKKIRTKMHRGPRPIFNLFNIEEQIESIYKPQVQLPSGGSIVISPTEALVAIDVNSGRTSKEGDFEKTIYLANMEAAAELARQLRLRDLGGLIVVDFIDMRSKKNIREVEKQVKQSMKRDKAKVDISTISRFGLMQISRQKMGAPIEKGSYRTCEYCQGRGVVRTVETQALYYLRRIQTGVSKKKVKRVECYLPVDVAQYLLNNKRAEIAELETAHEANIDIILQPEMKPGESRIEFLDS